MTLACEPFVTPCHNACGSLRKRRSEEISVPDVVEQVQEAQVEEPVAEEVLVEEVSIDGMCGVY
jgi:mycofactocin precursor